MEKLPMLTKLTTDKCSVVLQTVYEEFHSLHGCQENPKDLYLLYQQLLETKNINNRVPRARL